MKPHELTGLIDRYGVDPTRWPPEARAVLDSGIAPRELQAMEDVEQFLRLPVAPPSRELMDRVMTAPQHIAPLTMRLGFWSWLRVAPALAVAASLAAGIWVGPLNNHISAITLQMGDEATTSTIASADIPGLTWAPDDQNGDLL